MSVYVCTKVSIPIVLQVQGSIPMFLLCRWVGCVHTYPSACICVHICIWVCVCARTRARVFLVPLSKSYMPLPKDGQGVGWYHCGCFLSAANGQAVDKRP